MVGLRCCNCGWRREHVCFWPNSRPETRIRRHRRTYLTRVVAFYSSVRLFSHDPRRRCLAASAAGLHRNDHPHHHDTKRCRQNAAVGDTRCICAWSPAFAGHPEITYYTLLLMALFTAWRLLGKLVRKRGAVKHLVKPAIWLFSMVGVGIMLGSLQLLPSLELAQRTFAKIQHRLPKCVAGRSLNGAF